MSKPQRTPEGKWAIYHAVTGQRIERWPVDARGMVATGQYVVTPPNGAPGAPPVSAKDRGIIERPDAILPRDKRGEGPPQAVHHAPAETVEAEQVPAATTEAVVPAEPDAPGSTEPEPGVAPPAPDEFPPGYTFEKSGRFATLYDPQGRMVKSTTRSGKHDGLDAARAAAWAHAKGA